MKIGENEINSNVNVYAKTYDDNGLTLLDIRDEKYTRSISLIIDKDGIVNSIDIHGHDDKKIDIKKTKVKTRSNNGHSWRTMEIDGLGVTFHNSRK
tara:strand:- start:441 stop:728 length:288 start_codon:yes stop_codon:yes gene_type:complete